MKERDLISQLGIHITALTADNEKLRERLQAERDFRDKASARSRETYSIDEYLKSLFADLRRVMNSSQGSIVLRSQTPLNQDTHFYVVTQEGISQNDIEMKVMSLEKGKYISTALESGQSVVVDVKGNGHHSNSMIVPFGWSGVNHGAVCISNKEGQSHYTDEDRQTLVSCVKDIEHGIANIMKERSQLEGIAEFVEQKDPYTAAHSKRVSQLARLVAADCGVSVGEQYIIEAYGRLHDMGKIGIPDSILLKNGRLDEKEFLNIKEHPCKGERMLLRYQNSNSGASKNGRDILRYHHEKYDGTGYPDGLGGTDIPRNSRILNIVDSFDAMASNRCYRTALDNDEIVERINRDVKKQFDPNLTRLFLDILPSIAYADMNNPKKEYYSPFSTEALQIPADAFIAAKRATFEMNGYRPCESYRNFN